MEKETKLDYYQLYIPENNNNKKNYFQIKVIRFSYKLKKKLDWIFF